MFDKRQSLKLSLTPITKFALAESMMSEQMSINIMYSQCFRAFVCATSGNISRPLVVMYFMSYTWRGTISINFIPVCADSLENMYPSMLAHPIFMSTTLLEIRLSTTVLMDPPSWTTVTHGVVLNSV
jgi:hypothetical protein